MRCRLELDVEVLTTTEVELIAVADDGLEVTVESPDGEDFEVEVEVG